MLPLALRQLAGKLQWLSNDIICYPYTYGKMLIDGSTIKIPNFPLAADPTNTPVLIRFGVSESIAAPASTHHTKDHLVLIPFTKSASQVLEH